MNLLFLHRSGGGNPAAAFVEALPFYHPDKEIRELKEICENEGLVHVAGFFQNFDLTRKFGELTPDDMSKLATLLLQQESWKIVAEGLEMQSLIQQFAVAVMQNNSYCPTRYLLQLLAASRLYTVGELLHDLRAIGNVRAYNHLIERNFSVTR
ncbi:uncharacterized protein LOC130635339 [Hydractinia symbiolongicarpus]|uniref:uncharacterized protein LOC130635339 n=1 Tax=Hydractinia symbiolongicarpus TaxID=13093 RepID=UPI00254D1D91|nr:uncharacterized protein LOC130635339 [Hydractinia symbiolongicarpus]